MDDRTPMLEGLDITSDSPHIPTWYLHNLLLEPRPPEGE